MAVDRGATALSSCLGVAWRTDRVARRARATDLGWRARALGSGLRAMWSTRIGRRRGRRAPADADQEAARWSCFGGDAVDPDDDAPRLLVGSSSARHSHSPFRRLLAVASLFLPSVALALGH